MTILSNSWAQHLKYLSRNNDANKNMKAFTDALAPSTTTSKRLNALVEEVDAAVLLVGPKTPFNKPTAGPSLAGHNHGQISSGRAHNQMQSL
jgi:hypothetical protein